MDQQNLKSLFRILLFALSVQAACKQDKTAIIQEKVTERVNAFSAQKKAACKEALYEQAERIVDSLILLEAQQALLDSLARLRPNRPYQPPAVPPIDSLSIKPIFENPKQVSSNGG